MKKKTLEEVYQMIKKVIIALLQRKNLRRERKTKKRKENTEIVMIATLPQMNLMKDMKIIGNKVMMKMKKIHLRKNKGIREKKGNLIKSIAIITVQEKKIMTIILRNPIAIAIIKETMKLGVYQIILENLII